VIVAQLYTRSNAITRVLGQSRASSAPGPAPKAPAPAAAPAIAYTHLQDASAPLPSAQPGELLPPILVDTRAEIPKVRATLRAARNLAGAESGASGGFAYSEADAIARTFAAGHAAEMWQSLPLVPEGRNWADFEVQRDNTGRDYLVGFVSSEIGDLMGALGPELSLPARPAEKTAPKWQIWKKRTAPPVRVYAGSTITMYPDPSPEASVAIALPFDRIAGITADEVAGGVGRKTEILNVTLR
jgi:hypothetical protein